MITFELVQRFAATVNKMSFQYCGENQFPESEMRLRYVLFWDLYSYLTTPDSICRCHATLDLWRRWLLQAEFPQDYGCERIKLKLTGIPPVPGRVRHSSLCKPAFSLSAEMKPCWKATTNTWYWSRITTFEDSLFQRSSSCFEDSLPFVNRSGVGNDWNQHSAAMSKLLRRNHRNDSEYLWLLPKS